MKYFGLQKYFGLTWLNRSDQGKDMLEESG